MNKSFDLTRWQHWLATGLGSGLAPKAPGTVGSIAALPLCVLASGLSPIYGLLLILLVSVLGIYVSHVTSHDLGVPDHGGIVIDEWAGMLITFWLVPLSGPVLLLGFMLFRVLDIFKPWPIRWFDENLHGGLGIMLDDLVAGVLACALLHSVVWWFPSLTL